MQKFATEKRVLEAKKLIAAKARDMLRHYAATILPSGFKAQVVATSRRAAVRYQRALELARDELVADLTTLNPALLRLDEDDFAALPRETQYLISAFPFLDRIRTLEFAAEISHHHNDPPSRRRWTDKAKQREYERKFKLPFEHADPDKCSPLAFLCVQNMLLTGFNAPIEQVMYLDRRIYDHDLLQAIARVNRKRKGKKCGYVVDYVGIARAIRRALEGIDEETSDGGQVAEVLDEIPRLEDRHARVMQVFTGRGIHDIRDVERCVDLLEDERIRAEFINRLGDFLASLGIVMPRPDALPYLRDAKILGFISRVAANLYRDDQLNLLGVEPKVRRLIDQYIAAQGIDHKFEKVDITDIEFNERVARGRSSRARASEMLHALRHHIRIHTPEDPEFFRSMSEKLADILRQLQDKWDELERVLAEFIRNEAARGRQQEIEGLDPKVHAPFFGILKARIDQQRGNHCRPTRMNLPASSS
jgi:type I restriction enzyme, R subunit